MLKETKQKRFKLLQTQEINMRQFATPTNKNRDISQDGGIFRSAASVTSLRSQSGYFTQNTPVKPSREIRMLVK